ncbi:YveK family protein [Brevibacillus sp. 179-C 1.1 NHS]|uniref:YveK family protein n=1 Tax=Brevibacillus sp. 179-C 1.1 NHS TaxID=3235177 RepID=UPI0039A0AC60
MENLDIYSLVRVIKKRIWLIILIVLLAVSASYYVSYYVLVPEYQATSTIVVQGHSGDSLETLYNDVRANQELIKTYAVIIKSRKIAQEVISDLQLTMTTDQLLKKVRVQDTSESLVTSINVVDQDPARAVEIANSFARAFQTNLSSIMKVDNVKILDQAIVGENMTPIRPNPVINMGITFVVSFLTSVGLMFFIEIFDKTIRTEEQVKSLLAVPVLGVISVIDHRKQKSNDKLEKLERGRPIEEQETV